MEYRIPRSPRLAHVNRRREMYRERIRLSKAPANFESSRPQRATCSKAECPRQGVEIKPESRGPLMLFSRWFDPGWVEIVTHLIPGCERRLWIITIAFYPCTNSPSSAQLFTVLATYVYGTNSIPLDPTTLYIFDPWRLRYTHFHTCI